MTTVTTAGPTELTERQILLLAAASAIVTANAYYIHPIIARVAEEFSVSAALVGAVPALNQLALACGILLLLPLGDRVNNRRLVPLFLSAQTMLLVAMLLADDYWVFVSASSLLGFFTIAPYLLPAYVSKRVGTTRLGHVTAILTSGVIAGVLLSRAGSGVIAEYFGWRTVYVLAAALMLLATLALPLLMEDDPPAAVQDEQPGYGVLLLSLLPLLRTYPVVLLSGAMQGLSFGIFLCVWLGIGLHLTSPELGYGTDLVGYLSLLAVANLLTTPWLGRWADRVGPRRARLRIALVQLAGVCLLFVTGHSPWLLLVPITLMNVAGPIIDVTGRMTFLALQPSIRTRLMTVYIVLMFIGGGFGSWAGTIAYDLAGWNGTAALSLLLSLLVLALALFAFRLPRVGADRARQ
ncbi:MAG: MFS transporter [Pseudomonadota bacterium]